MQKSTITIQHQEGVHTRPASIFVREAGKFKSEVTLSCEGVSVNGKSIMGLLMLALGPGSEVLLTTEGPDEEGAIETLSELLSGRFQ